VHNLSILHSGRRNGDLLPRYTDVDDTSSIAGMDQVDLLLPAVILDLIVTRATIKVADETAEWNPEDGRDGDDGHCNE
jgi:phage-related baseplate assembly protein